MKDDRLYHKAGYLDELARVREMLDRRYDDIESGQVSPTAGEVFFERLREREEALLQKAARASMTDSQMKSKRAKLAPVHPGEILREDFLKPLGLSINALARALHVPPNHVSAIVNEKRGVSALMALRLARYFGTSPELWLGLQQDYELDLARDTAAAKIEIEVLPRAS